MGSSLIVTDLLFSHISFDQVPIDLISRLTNYHDL